jgi:hypothetical protein
MDHTTMSSTEDQEQKCHLHGITINYWRMGHEGRLDHFSVYVSIQLARHRITWTMTLHADTTQNITLDGRTITLDASEQDIGLDIRETNEHLGMITLIDNDQPLP